MNRDKESGSGGEASATGTPTGEGKPPGSSGPVNLVPNGSGTKPADTAKSGPTPSGAVAVDGLEIGDIVEVKPGWAAQLKTLLIGKPRDLADKSLYHSISLAAFLAWVGLGADGLSSSCYGPPEAFINLKGHDYLAVFLALAIAGTVFVISSCYSHLIEHFPSGGGGYIVASKLLGPRIGVVSGCALLIDYVLTITASIAAAGDALFGLLGPDWGPWKLTAEYGVILVLIVLNLRGVKESVQVLLPIFITFLVTHAILIGGALVLHMGEAPALASSVARDIQHGLNDPKLGLLGMLSLLLYAYSLGAGTYTGIEAVSNSMQVMREPRVATGKRTMLYMSISLALTAGGLIIVYLLLAIKEAPGKTMNHTLIEAFVEQVGLGTSGLGSAFLWVTLVSEGALLIVAAQTGFIDGPRGLANLAHDSWLPRWFSSLSERLAVHNGVLLMGGAALAALAYTGGSIGVLLVMYAINVFVTFSLSMISMCRFWYQQRGQHPFWRRRLALFVLGAVLCTTILVVTVLEKFWEGAWKTVVVTLALVLLCFLVKRYYREVWLKLRKLDETLAQITPSGEPNLKSPDPGDPTAVLLVGAYNGLGIHTLLNAVRFSPDLCKNFVFISAGVVDSGNFKGSDALRDLHLYTEETLRKYVDLGQRLGVPSTSFMTIGTDPVDDLERLSLTVAQQYPRSTVFAGQLVFQKDTWLRRMMHNQTAYSLQRRLQWAGIPVVILPTRVR